MVVAIDQALAAAKIPHAIGGALAYAYYAEPRVTIDVEVNVFVSTERWPEVRKTLDELGIDVSTDEPALARDGQVRLWWGRIAVDLFFSYDPFHDEMEGAIRRVPFGDVRIPILGPEHRPSARRCSTGQRTGSTSRRCWLSPIRSTSTRSGPG
jgi:hypothetical protein